MGRIAPGTGLHPELTETKSPNRGQGAKKAPAKRATREEVGAPAETPAIVGDEDSAKKAPAKRATREVGAPPEMPAIVADEDLLIPRPDLGRAAATFVGKGERIPDAARPFLT